MLRVFWLTPNINIKRDVLRYPRFALFILSGYLSCGRDGAQNVAELKIIRLLKQQYVGVQLKQLCSVMRSCRCLPRGCDGVQVINVAEYHTRSYLSAEQQYVFI